MDETDPKCVICGEPASGTREKCGLAYCVHHRGVEARPGEPPVEGEEGPILCWNCRASRDALAAPFWVVLGAVGFVCRRVFALWY